MGTIDIHRFNEVRLIMVVMLPVSVAPSKATARRHGMRKDFSMRPAAAGGEQQTYAKTPVFQKKQQLLDAVAPLNRGAEASETDKARIENLAAQLCKENPTAKPFESELINRKWRLSLRRFQTRKSRCSSSSLALAGSRSPHRTQR